MDQDLETLRVLAEVSIAFVAFSAIVASLRINLGQELSAFQRLLVHFFTEAGMLNVTVALFPLVLSSFYEDERIISVISIIYILASTLAYLTYYIGRRIRIKAPTPLLSSLVMIGFAVWEMVLVLVVTGVLWEPTLGLIQAFCLWSLISSAMIFAYFLSTFVDPTNPQSRDKTN